MEETAKSSTGPRGSLRCSFCGKNESEVRQMITADADSTIAICDECVRYSYEIVSFSDLQP